MGAIKRSILKDAGRYELEFSLMIDAIAKSLEEAVHAPPEKEDKPKKARVKRSKANSTTKTKVEVQAKNACTDHPSYGAKRRPRTGCEGCWSMYRFYNQSSYEKARRDFERAQSRRD